MCVYRFCSGNEGGFFFTFVSRNTLLKFLQRNQTVAVYFPDGLFIKQIILFLCVFSFFFLPSQWDFVSAAACIR